MVALIALVRPVAISRVSVHGGRRHAIRSGTMAETMTPKTWRNLSAGAVHGHERGLCIDPRGHRSAVCEKSARGKPPPPTKGRARRMDHRVG